MFFRKRIEEAIFPVGLIGFGYAAIITIAIGRAGFGLDWSTTSRYMSLPILSQIGIIIVAYQLFLSALSGDNGIILKNEYRKKLFLWGSVGFMALFSIIIVIGNFRGLSEYKRYGDLTDNVNILQYYEQQPLERLQRLYLFSSYEDAYNKIGVLKKYRLNVFSRPTFTYSEIFDSRLNGLKEVKLEHWLGINKESIQWDDKFVYLQDPGWWAFDYISQKEYTQVYMKVNNKLYTTSDHLPSPDLAAYFKNKHYSNARFSFSFPINKMITGENDFSVIVILNDGLTYYETETIKIYKGENESLSVSYESFSYEEFIDYNKEINVNLDAYSVVNELEIMQGNTYRTAGDDSYIYYELNKYIHPAYCTIEFEQVPEDNMRVELLYTHGEDYWSNYEEIIFYVYRNADKRYILKFEDETQGINRIRLSFRYIPNKEFKIKNISIYEK
jgi:hypothetical protein